MHLWILVYMFRPDFRTVDQGTAYIPENIMSTLGANSISLEQDPIETPGAIGIVNCYHDQLRSDYTKLGQSPGRSEVTHEDCLKMAVWWVKAPMEPEGLCRMLPVFGALPRPARITVSSTQLKVQLDMEQAKVAVQQEEEKRIVAFDLGHPWDQKAKENSKLLRDLPLGVLISVNRA